MMNFFLALLMLLTIGLEAHSSKSGEQKILVLIIASDNLPVYESLQEIWREYMHLDPDHIEAYFIKADPNLEEECQIDGDIVWLRTSESLIPGILKKTLMAMECFLPRMDEFDYILRTNLSSFYVFPRLLAAIRALPSKRCYHAMPIPMGKPFLGSGAGFLLSPDLVSLLVKDKEWIFKRLGRLYDDVAIGKYLVRQKVRLLHAKRFDLLTLDAWFARKDRIPEGQYHFRVKNPNSKLRFTDDVYIHSELLKMFY